MTSKKAGTDPSYSVYMLLCDNGSFYTGIARDIARRLEKHRRGTGDSKYTRSFRPRKLLACWKVAGSRGEAQRIEHLIKSRGRRFKEAIIADPGILTACALKELGIKARRSRTGPADLAPDGPGTQPPLR